MPLSRRIDRMMKVGDLPTRLRGRQCSLQPLLLFLIEVIRVECEELDQISTTGERVVSAPTHIELGIIDLSVPPFFIIVIAKYGLELDIALEQLCVWPFEFGRHFRQITVR